MNGHGFCLLKYQLNCIVIRSSKSYTSIDASVDECFGTFLRPMEVCNGNGRMEFVADGFSFSPFRS